MRQSISFIDSVTLAILLGALPSACGTKGPLTLTPAQPKAQAVVPAQAAPVPVPDANTVAGQH